MRHSPLPSVLLLALLSLTTANTAAAAILVRGPYLQLGTPTTTVVRWRTDTPDNSRLRYGTGPGAFSEVAFDPTLRTEHQIELTGLTPSTRYYYAPGSDAGDFAGPAAGRTFLTAPPVGATPPVRIWVLGDSGTANADAAAVRDAYQAASNRTDLWLMLGDNAYTEGTDSEYQEALFDMYPSFLESTSLWPTLGNHDVLTSESSSETGPYFDQFTLPTAGEAGGLPSGSEAYYSFDYANIHFISLDSADTDLDPTGAMLQWLAADAANTDQEWIVAFWHHPPYTKGSHDSDDEGSRMAQMRENVLPILENCDVDLVLSGHSHSYERSKLLEGHYGDSTTFNATMVVNGEAGDPAVAGPYYKPPDDSRGAVYAVAGSSGKVTSDVPFGHPAMVLSVAELGSLILDFEGSRLNVRFLSAAGDILDEMALVKAEAPLFADGFGSGDTSRWSATSSP
jgi:hypothetical protein